jgi:hypothetical protein
MSKTPPHLADLPEDVKAFVAAQAAELARKDAEILGLSLSHASAQKRLKDEKVAAEASLDAERTAHARAIQNRDMIIADLRLQLYGHKKHRFGPKSENSAQLALELILEDMEIEQAAETEGGGEEGASSDVDAKSRRANASCSQKASSGSRRPLRPVRPAKTAVAASKCSGPM